MTQAAVAARWLAIGIAVLGVVDPALTSMRDTEPEIAIVAATPADSALAAQLSKRLGERYTVVDGAWQGAAATVLVGTTLPDRIPDGPLFAVRDPDRLAVTRFDLPATVAADARFAVPVEWTRSSGRAELRANGVVASRDSSSFEVTPASAGPLLLQVHVADGGDSVTVDALTSVVDQPAAVLFFDRRPSWMSTFVRRSLERDRRFAVASRVITSRAVSTDVGQPPSSLSDPTLLELYDVIVVGTPASLTAADVAGLETFLRRRGGSVVLLYDEAPRPGAHDRLTGVSRWTPATLRVPVPVRDGADSAAARVAEAAWPTALPRTATVRGTARITDADRPLVWSTALGAGQVLVSGALDAWKYRDRSTSGFDEFWRAAIGRAAREAADAIEVEVTPNLLEPGERATVRVRTRDTTAATVLVRVDSMLVQMWPGDRAGEFVGRIHAPEPGAHRISATAGGARADVPVVVRESVQRLGRDDWRAIRVLARASGGVAGTIEEVEHAVTERIVVERRMERWWVMRTGWWMVGFVGLLGFEWLVRRRKGLG